MLELEAELQKRVDRIIEISNQDFKKKKYDQSIQLLEKAWEQIPEPKGLYFNSYDIVKDILDTYFVTQRYKEGEKWLEKLFLTGLDRIDSGEREFCCGQFAYELEKFEIAKEYFRIAEKKSEGSCFEDEDVKYLKFYKQK